MSVRFDRRWEVDRPSPRAIQLVQLGVVLGAAAVVALAYLLHGGIQAETDRTIAILASGDGPAIGEYLRSYGPWAPVASLFLMVLQAIAAPVPTVFIAFANGLTFGVVWGGLLTDAGQTLAAAVCFGIARALGRASIEALTGKLGLEAADCWFTRWGARGVLVTRLVPGISFDLVSYAAGLTGIGFGSFLLATAVGSAPQAFLYAYLIREAPQTAWVFLAVAWVVVAGISAVAIVRARRTRAITDGARAAPTPRSDKTLSPPGADARRPGTPRRGNRVSQVASPCTLDRGS